MAKKDDIGKIFEQMKADQEKINGLTEKLEQGLGKQLKMQNDILKAKREITHLENEKLKAIEEQVEEEKAREVLNKKFRKARAAGDKKAEKALLKELKELRKIANVRKAIILLKEDDIEMAERGLKIMQDSVRESNKLKSTWKSMKGIGKTWGWDKLRSWGVFDMDKEVRNTIKSMGVGSNNAAAFRDNMSKAADSTTMMGTSFKKLAKMQGGYSKAIGRTVKLNKEGLISMSEMSEGTGLGEQYAIGMASGMDNFGVSVIGAKDLVQETLDIASQMGVNSAAAAESLQKNLKLAQRFHFKGGVKGLAKMANEAVRLKLDMDGIAGLAEKVFRPEGAIEMAAKLQTMGGAFAQMANPMEMLFNARNDPAKFAKQIGAATAEFVEYNKETKSFEIKGGLAADRMREISTMTGIGVEKLQEMAVQQKKIEKIGSMVPFSYSKEDREFIAGVADMNDKGELEVNIGGTQKLIKELADGDMLNIRDAQKNLADRAKESRTFEETMNDLFMTLKQTLLPVAEGLKTYLADPLMKLQNSFKEEGFYDHLRSFAKGAIELAGSIGKFIIENPIKSLVIGGATLLAGKAAQWIFNGKMLRIGFGSGGPGGGGTTGGFGTTGGKIGPALPPAPLSAMQKLGGQGVMGGKFAAGTMGSMGAMAGLGIAGSGMKMARDSMDNKHSAGGAALGIGGNALNGAAMGAMFGPWGALAGGVLGAGYGIYDEYGSDEAKKRRGGVKGKGAPIAATTKIEDGIIEFNPKDKFLGVKNVVASTSANQLKTVEDNITGGNNSIVEHKFSDLIIKFKFEGAGDISEDKLLAALNSVSISKVLEGRAQSSPELILGGGKTKS